MIKFILALTLLFSSLCFAGSSNAISVRTDYGVTPVGTGAPVVLIASLPYATSHISVFDSSGQTMEIRCANGLPSQTSIKIFPGGGDWPLHCSAGESVSIIAISGPANAAGTENDLNIFF